jgi:hypothetical protein
MSHQPFETWILDPDPLTKEDRRSLQDHLDSCAQCQQIQRRWQSVHLELRARPMALPAPGFTMRWQSGLAERRARQQRRQAWKIFGYFAGGALFILLLLSAYLLATTTPADWLSSGIRLLTSSRNLIDLGAYLVDTWLASTSLAVNLALWIYLTVGLCLLSMIWVLILWRTNLVGVLNK